MEYATLYQAKTAERLEEMQQDDNSHYLIYQVLGVSQNEGVLIDQYQNKGRFLYNYAGKFLEKTIQLCFQTSFPDAQLNIKIPNLLSQRPKTFEVDILHRSFAYEIKWRDATTDGDHITKEHARLQAVSQAGYTPIRLMFYAPQRDQAIRIQATLATLYQGMDGFYFQGEHAWQHVFEQTHIDLEKILINIAGEQTNGAT